VSISVVDLDDMAEPLHEQQVMSRFGRHNYVRLSDLNQDETEEFMQHLVHEWTDPDKRDALISAHSSDADGEQVTADSFPFTKDGLKYAAEFAAFRDGGGYTTPRDIQKVLDDLLNRAIDDGKHIVSKPYLTTLINT
jgi:hypothetical protein